MTRRKRAAGKRPGGRRPRDRRAAERALGGVDQGADWTRVDHVREEAMGGTVATPDEDVVDGIGEALGVPRAPDDEFRTSAEILEGRDRYRWEEEE